MLPRGGWFPAEEYLSGLHEVNATYQYVSTGLGAAHRTPFRFRLWNTKDNRWCGRVAIFGSWIAIWNRQ